MNSGPGGINDQQNGVLVGRMGMLPVQVDAGFPEGGQYVHLTEVKSVPFGTRAWQGVLPIAPDIWRGGSI
jgi:hypothetical protein